MEKKENVEDTKATAWNAQKVKEQSFKNPSVKV